LRDEELPIIRSHYDFLVWLIPKIGKFPRSHADTWRLWQDLLGHTIFSRAATD